MDTIACKAQRAFTYFVPGYGQVHGDPDNAEAREPLVPVSVISHLVDQEKIEEPDGWVDPAADTTPPPPPSDPAPVGDTSITMTHLGRGRYEIKGPGVPEGTFAQGKRDAQTMVELARERHANASAVAQDDGAPI
ncbi:MAG: hypothetical protein DI547_04945 [Sphingobium sp.]|nr:MAG: hypothetical protein DI547_04945 [Sphingobium sp.]